MAARQSIGSSNSLASTTYVASYVGPNIFTVAGDQTAVFACGDVVYVPEMNAVSGVVESVYDGSSMTKVYLADAILIPGLVRVNRVNRKISENLCTTSGAISGGYYAAANVPSKAFDGDYTTAWVSSQSGTGISGNAYIGCTFATARKIRWVRILQNDPSMIAPISSVLLQYYDGAAWVTTQTISLARLSPRWEMDVFAVPAVASTQWRLLANVNLATGYYWGVVGLEMGE